MVLDLERCSRRCDGVSGESLSASVRARSTWPPWRARRRAMARPQRLRALLRPSGIRGCRCVPVRRTSARCPRPELSVRG
eukprot:5307257-Amphidinium_carterae.3